MKYSVSPESDNATVRLLCFATRTINPTTVSNSLINSKSSPKIQEILDPEDIIELPINNPNDLSKKLRPVISINEAHKV
jgi:hypothetical protein